MSILYLESKTSNKKFFIRHFYVIEWKLKFKIKYLALKRLYEHIQTFIWLSQVQTIRTYFYLLHILFDITLNWPEKQCFILSYGDVYVEFELNFLLLMPHSLFQLRKKMSSRIQNRSSYLALPLFLFLKSLG